jgi:hypothetical protein
VICLVAALDFVPMLCTLRCNIRRAAAVELKIANSFHAKLAWAVLKMDRKTQDRASVDVPVV